MQDRQEKPHTNGNSSDHVVVHERITKKNGETSIKKYIRGKILGKGGFATCYEMTDLEKNRTLAAKIIAKSSLTKKRALEKLLAEIKIHKSLHHENIVQFEHVFEDKENVYILLEICPNQTLKELLKRRKRITELECAFYLTQTISALKYLHERKIIHRDLKLGNLFLGKNFDIKLGDFGLAAKIEHDGERRRTICGTPNYIAPEVLDKKQGHSYEVDIWSLGVVCYTLLIGKPPFETTDTKTTYRRILKVSYAFPSSVPISDEAKDLIRRILVLDPSKRPTLDELLQHPFIKNHSNKVVSSNPLDSSNLKKSTLTLTSQKDLGHMRSPSEKGYQHTDAPEALEKNIEEPVLNERNSDPNLLNEKKEPERIRPQTTEQKLKKYTLNGYPPKTLGNLNGPINEIHEALNDLEVYVSKWVDYSSKYGLGYLLTDGTCGVVFNDSTRMMLSPNEKYFEYIEKKPGQIRDILSVYNVNNYPRELLKKVTLLNHFKDYMGGDERNEIEKLKEDFEKKPLIYITKWIKTKNALLFKLSNRIVQVDFQDKTQIILSAGRQIVHYKNKKGERSQHNLETALDLDYPEMVKRLKYTKEILTYLRNNNAKDGDLQQTAQFRSSTKFPSQEGTGRIQQMHGLEPDKEGN